MAKRKKAGPRLGLLNKLIKLPVLSDEQWRHLAVAFDPGAPTRADTAKLPDHHSLRHGFDRAISFAIDSLAADNSGPYVRETQRELERFLDDLKKLTRSYIKLSPDSRALLTDAYDGCPDLERVLTEALKRIPVRAAEIEDEAGDGGRNLWIDFFLSDIIWLTKSAGVRTALPSRSDNDRAVEYPVYRVSRAAVALACAIAKAHAPAAAVPLSRLQRSKPSTFVDKLHRARRRPPMLPGLLLP
jgi:hypothetical protein